MQPNNSNIEPNQLHSHSSNLLSDLLEINELGSILGYSDLRSTRDWCNKFNVPLFGLGKRTYTCYQYLEEHIQTLIEDSFSKQKDVKPLTKSPSKSSKVKRNGISEASKKFLNDE